MGLLDWLAGTHPAPEPVATPAVPGGVCYCDDPNRVPWPGVYGTVIADDGQEHPDPSRPMRWDEASGAYVPGSATAGQAPVSGSDKLLSATVSGRSGMTGAG